MIDPRDMEHCREAIRVGSRSFHAASKLLPRKVRDPALALYAFCRLADDAVDEGDAKTAAVLRLRDRMDLAYGGTPADASADRAFAAIVREFEMPRALPDALLEGLAWDADERRYASLSELRGYSARVAAAVGAMMCVLMRSRDADTLARACDLGVAMQLTNIARDVGEDARAGRLYLPTDWFAEAGLDLDAFLADPQPRPEIRGMVRRLLREADRLYIRATSGVAALPTRSRPGILAARYIYARIGRDIVRHGHDSVTRRARSSGMEKVGMLALSLGQAGAIMALPRSAVLHAPPLPETAFLVEAAARPGRMARSGALFDILGQLEHKDRARRRATS